MLDLEMATVVDRLEELARTRPDDTAFVFVKDRRLNDEKLTYGELHARAAAVAGALAERGCSRGERVLLVYPSGLAYVAAFFGCLLAGAIAVPVYPPASEQHLGRLRKVIDDCRPRVVLTDSTECLRLGRLFEEMQGPPAGLCCTDDLPPSLASVGCAALPFASDVALLQYTSGSTGNPKGVVITHGNLSANQRLISRAFRGDEPGTVVGWLPLYHDMGLIGCVIQSVFWGYPYVFMSPLTFMQHPVAWLQAISRYGAVRSGGPNFAYELCAAKVKDEQMEGLDLSAWRTAFCGAEQIRRDSLLRFAQRFAPVGFDVGHFLPCYGLAEATLFVSGSQAEGGLQLHEPTGGKEDAVDTSRFAGCGEVAPELDVRIVDPETRVEKPEGEVGEVWAHGASIAHGYWRQPELSEAVFDARIEGAADGRGYLRTGDLGFLRDGELVIAGRLKELLIVNGRNLYPHDIETVAEAQGPELRTGHTAAVLVRGEGTEGLAIVAEVDRMHRNRTDFGELACRIVAAVVTTHGVAPRQVVFLPPGGQLKTSSGKLRRTDIGRRLAAGELEPLYAWPRAAAPVPAPAEIAGAQG